MNNIHLQIKNIKVLKMHYKFRMKYRHINKDRIFDSVFLYEI